MNDKEKRPTSGFVAGFGGECGFSGAQHDSGFSNISEVYVSKSGFSRLLSAVRYGKRYMLKCLKPDFAFTPVYRQALMKEFEIGLQLDHPNICRTISMEPVEELGECIVMEYVDGENLETAVTSGTFTEEKACKIAAQLLDAMEYMHAAIWRQNSCCPEPRATPAQTSIRSARCSSSWLRLRTARVLRE